MPNGLACAPRIFTKLLKPVFSFLRSRGFLSVYYLDDSLLIGRSKEECEGNLRVTLNLLTELGFIVNMNKSVLTPIQDLEFLGFHINSQRMELYLSDHKKKKIARAAALTKVKDRVTIRDFASVIGTVVASFPAVRYGKMRYRNMERLKCEALRLSHGNFDHLWKLVL